jgi:hypothetical protein
MLLLSLLLLLLLLLPPLVLPLHTDCDDALAQNVAESRSGSDPWILATNSVEQVSYIETRSCSTG